MQISTILLGVAATALATPIMTAREDATEFQSISFQVDDDGAGNITIGADLYRVVDINLTDSVRCRRMNSEIESLVTCTISLPSSEFTLASIDKREEAVDHLPYTGSPLFSVFTGLQLGRAPNFTASYEASPLINDTDLDISLKKVPQCGTPYNYAVLVGNGNPHQNPLHVQLSENLACRDGDCTIGYATAHSFSIGFTANAEAWGWLSGGFVVQSSIETGNLHECGGGPGEVVSVWKHQAQTAYTVQNVRANCLGLGGNPYVMWSPNQYNRGGRYYCARGQEVRHLNFRWTDLRADHPGGPPSW